MTQHMQNIPPAAVTYPPLTQVPGDEIDLRELIKTLWAGKWIIVVCALLLAGLTAIYAIMQPNVYKSEALLAPAASESKGGLSALAGQFGGLASLAGINLSSGGGDKTALALEVLKSRAFIQAFIKKHDLLAPLMAAKGWDAKNQEWKYDLDRYNPVTGEWIKQDPNAKQAEPTDWEAYKTFSEVLSVNQDKQTGFVRLSIMSYSPETAKQWVDWLVQDLNAHMRTRDIEEAQASTAYLEEQIQKTTVAAMQQVFYQLIEEQAKRIMLASVSEEYVFKTVDPAVVPEEKAKPKRALMVAVAGIGGGFLGIMLVLVRGAMRRTEPDKASVANKEQPPASP